MKAQCEHSDTGLCESCFKYETLKADVIDLSKTFYKDICSTNQTYFPKPICRREPPEISNFFNACLSCQIADTCRKVKAIRETVGIYE